MPSFPDSRLPVNAVRVVPDPRPHPGSAAGDGPAGDELPDDTFRADLDREADEVEAALRDPRSRTGTDTRAGLA
jgi:hypothetical protein